MRKDTFFRLCWAALIAIVIGMWWQPFVRPPAGPFTALDGQTIELNSQDGNPRVVVFWATWCGYCRSEIPHLIELYEKYRQKGLIVVGISNESDTDEIRSFVKSNKISYPILLVSRNDSNLLRRSWGDRDDAIPFMVTIDRSGRVIERVYGAQSLQRLQVSVERIL